MPIIVPCILLLREILHLRHVWDTLPKSPMDFYFGKTSEVDGQDDADKSKRFILRIQHAHRVVHKNLEKIQDKYKARCDKHQFDHQF
jgi:hypothetical protein